MDLHDYWKKAGTERTKRVVAAAGVTSWAYARHLYKCRKPISPDLAANLVKACEQDNAGRPKKDRLVMSYSSLVRTKAQLEARMEELRRIA